MVAAIAIESVRFDERTGRYRSPAGGFLSRQDVRQIIRAERMRLAARLERNAKSLIRGNITLAQWEEKHFLEIKDSSVITTQIGAGGRKRTGRRQLNYVTTELERQKGFLQEFSRDVKAGVLSESQVIARARQYSNSSTIVFGRSEKEARRKGGWLSAFRWLAADAKHCRHCPLYSTRGLWLPISQVVSIGHRCECGGNCQCGIRYSKLPPDVLNQRGILDATGRT